MSETDDTDVLLLIPPDFFLVRSSGSEESLLESSRTVIPKPKSCTAQVIGKLVSQVHCLESRLDTLQISTTITDSSFGTIPRRKNWESDSLDSHSVDKKSFTFPRRRRRKVTRKRHDLSLSSLHTLDSRQSKVVVPRLNLKEYELASLSSKVTYETPSMDGDISSIVSTPSKNNDKLLLHEIDEFLTKVEAYESPETKYKGGEPSETSLSPNSPPNVIKATGDYIAQKIDSKNYSDEVKLPSGRIVPSSILEKYIYLVRNRSGDSSNRDSVAPSTSQERQLEARHLQSEAPKEISKSVSETKSPTVRRLTFAERKQSSDVQPTSTPKKQLSANCIDTFKPTSNKIYDRATKVLEQYKSQNYSRYLEHSNTDNIVNTENNYQNTACHSRSTNNISNTESNNRVTDNNRNTDYKRTDNIRSTNYKPPFSESQFVLKEEFKLPQMRPYVHDNKELKTKMMDTIDTELLSLSELWGDRGEKRDKDRGDSNRLEEERLKREHCESLIQELQKKLLDQQQRLAVAVKVDRAKDCAILKLKDAWVKLTGSLDRAEERHRAALDRIMREVDGFKVQVQEAQKKTNHFEAELYKALDLAHDYQDKCKLFANETQLTKETAAKELAIKEEAIAAREHEIQVLKDNYETVMRLNKQSTDCVRNLEEVLAKERTEHEQTRSLVTDLQSKLQSHADDVISVQRERDVLRETANEERARRGELERQLCEERRDSAQLAKRCEALDAEVKTLHKHMELQKSELKVHYQKQLEDAVLAKLQEFQLQLDHATREMEEENKRKEMDICESFQKQLGRIEEQHRLEVSVLEEKHREETKLYRLQLAQAGERTGLLENKLETYRRRRGQIASQLHSVMEAQWRQALLILTNGQPTELGGARAESVSTPITQDFSKIPPLMLSRDHATPAAPPRDSRDSDMALEGFSDRDLRQYVHLLLTKPPTMVGSCDGPRELTSACTAERKEPAFDPRRDEEPTSDRADRKTKEYKRSLGSKPPWKA